MRAHICVFIFWASFMLNFVEIGILVGYILQIFLADLRINCGRVSICGNTFYLILSESVPCFKYFIFMTAKGIIRALNVAAIIVYFHDAIKPRNHCRRCGHGKKAVIICDERGCGRWAPGLCSSPAPSWRGHQSGEDYRPTVIKNARMRPATVCEQRGNITVLCSV